MEVVDILELSDTLSDEKTKQFLNMFECKKDRTIEKFIKNNAIDFARQKLSSTFILVEKGMICGIFTLTHKPLSIRKSNISSRYYKRLSRFSTDTDGDNLHLSAFLIAQLAKNSKLSKDCDIDGSEIVNIALQYLIMARKIIGGKCVYVDVKNNDKLINFYKNNGFIEFDKRYSEKDKIEYLQMMRFV